MSLSRTDAEAMRACASNITSMTGDIGSKVEALVQKCADVSESFTKLLSYNGQEMADRFEKQIGTMASGAPVTVPYGYVANVSDNGLSGKFSAIASVVENIYADLAAINNCASEVSASADNIQRTEEEAEETALAVIGASSSGSGGSGGGYSGGGGSGSYASPASKKPYSKASTKKTDALGTSSDKVKGVLGAYNSNKNTSNTNNASRTSGTSYNGISSRNNKIGTSSSNSQGLSRSSRSGGGYSGGKSYISSKNNDKDSNNPIKSIATSISDVIKNGKLTRLPSSNLPILGSDKVMGSSVVPVASGLSAAGAAGVGAKAFFNSKKDDDDDNELEYLGTEQINNVADESEHRVKTVEDYEAESNVLTDDDSFMNNNTDIADILGEKEEKLPDYNDVIFNDDQFG